MSVLTRPHVCLRPCRLSTEVHVCILSAPFPLQLEDHFALSGALDNKRPSSACAACR